MKFTVIDEVATWNPRMTCKTMRSKRLKEMVRAAGGTVAECSWPPEKLLGAKQEPSNLFWLFAGTGGQV